MESSSLNESHHLRESSEIASPYQSINENAESSVLSEFRANGTQEEPARQHRHQSMASEKDRMVTELKSRLVELVVGAFCILLWRLPLVFEWYPLFVRPIPYQKLENGGDYVINLTHDQEFVGDTVSSKLYLFVGGLIPLLLQCFIGRIWGKAGDVHATVCVFCVALGLTGFVTEWIKNYAGYLRPIFYQLCQPNDDYTACTNEEKEDDARRSFPSGHASISFAGLTVLTLYLHNRFGLPSVRVMKSVEVTPEPTTAVGQQQQSEYILVPSYNTKHVYLYRLISLLSLTPMGVATFVAASRVHDNKHFPADVIAGAILGGSISVFVYNLWFL